MDILTSSNQFRADGHAPSGLDFVASQHPDLDTSIAKKLERGLDVLLQLVLDTSDAEEFKVALEVFADYFCHSGITVVQRQRSLCVLGREFLVCLRRKLLASDNESSETFSGHVRCLFVQPVIGGDDGCHDGIGTLLVEPDFTVLFRRRRHRTVVELHNYTHPLPL
jgi:hypothetical protein